MAGERDVTGAVAVREDGRFHGLVVGLPQGRATVRDTTGRYGYQPVRRLLDPHRTGDSHPVPRRPY